jgi:hypothetical protein
LRRQCAQEARLAAAAAAVVALAGGRLERPAAAAPVAGCRTRARGQRQVGVGVQGRG